MAKAATRTRPGPRLVRSQHARRARVLETVLDLGREGGYDAIQLRTVAERSNVSADTIYRYFGSRDALISTATALWSEREFHQPAPSWPKGKTPAERLLSYSRRVWEAWERNPKMLEVMVRAALAEGHREDGLGARSMRALVPVMADVLKDVEPGYRADVLMLMEHVTHSAMTYVVRGHLAVGDVFPIIERTIRRLAQHPAMDGHRPKSWDVRAAP